MKYSLPVSIIAHVAIAASGMFVWSVTPDEFIPEPIVVRLENIELGDEVDIKEIVKPDVQPEEKDEGKAEDEPIEDETPEPEDLREETKTKDTSTDDIIPDLTDDKPPPEPTPSPSPTPTLTPTPTPSKKPIVEERTKGNEKPSLDDLLADTEDLLKDLQKETKPKKKQVQRKELKDQGTDKPRNSAGKNEGNQARVIDVIKSQIKQRECYRSVKDLPDWEKLDVTIRFQLDSKGRISKPPERIEPKSIDSHSRLILVASERAIRAIQLCAPFNLPEEEYDLWKNEDIILTFDEAF